MVTGVHVYMYKQQERGGRNREVREEEMEKRERNGDEREEGMGMRDRGRNGIYILLHTNR